MRYLAVFFAAALAAGPALLGLGLALAPAPVPAEYWVRQALVIKKEIAREHRAQRKVVVMGGSSALFGIDTAMLGRLVGAPALNLATNANIPLEDQLSFAGEATSAGDVVILALEPGYYCTTRFNTWYMRNMIAWDREKWDRMGIEERAQALWRLGPWFLVELAIARIAQAVAPQAIRDRLDALDDAITLRRFEATRSRPAERFAYTIENIDGLGNIRNTEGPHGMREEGYHPSTQLRFCAEVRETLRDFAERARGRGVEVRLAYFPFFAAPEMDAAAIGSAARAFERQVPEAAPLLEPRAQVTFDRSLFFDTVLHLNAEGRRRRTENLARAISRDPALFPGAR